MRKIKNSSYIKLGAELKKIVLLSDPVILHIKNNGTKEAKKLASDIYIKIIELRSRLDYDYSRSYPEEFNTDVFYGGIERREEIEK